MGMAKIIIPKKDLQELYWKQYLSPAKIAKIYSCDRVTVRTRMKELSIQKRSNSEARMRYRKFDFSGNIVEKAYMIGFRLGDLNIYQTSNKSSLIIARCNTTQDVQVKLIQELFSKYGQVTASYGKYGTNVNCFLNKSFNFLIPKHQEVPSWIGLDDKSSAAFIAGYTDAEGNFLLNQTRARFKIDSYDSGVLKWIERKLIKWDILVKIRCIASKGSLAADGSRFKYDLWRININRAASLLNFINRIKVFAKHEIRIQQMNTCVINIKERIKKGSVKYATI